MLENLLELIRAERPVEDGGFGVLIEYKLAGLGGELAAGFAQGVFGR